MQAAGWRATIDEQPSILESIWRFKWRVITVAAFAAVVAVGLSMLQPTLYRAEGTVLLKDPRTFDGIASEIGLVLDPTRFVRNQAEVMESPQVAQQTAQMLGGSATASGVQGATAAVPANNLDALKVTAALETSDAAVKMVNTLVASYEAVVIEQVQNAAISNIATLEASKIDVESRIVEFTALLQDDPDDPVLRAQQTAAVDQLIALEHRIDQMSTNVALYGSGVQVYVEPNTPQAPIQPKPLRNAVVAFGAGALAASLWAWWRADSNRMAKDRHDPAAVLHAPLLAAIPDFRLARTKGPAPTISDPTSPAAASFEFALSSVEFALEEIGGTSVLLTSASPGDGKTTVALNLAISATRNGHRPLLIDADERARGLTFLSGLTNTAGLTDLNRSTNSRESTQQWALLDGTTLDFVPAGVNVPNSTAGFFGSEAFRNSLGTLIDGWPIVFIDSPPVMAAAETAALATVADAAVLVVSEGTTLQALESARDRLSISATPLIGYIFNRAMSPTGIAGYGYVGDSGKG